MASYNNDDLKRVLSQLNEIFQGTKKKIQTSNIDDKRKEDLVQKLHKARNSHESTIRSKLNDDLGTLNNGGAITVKGGTVMGELPQKGLPDASKVVGQGKENMWAALKKGKLKGKLGLALLPAAAAMMLPKDSMAGEIAQKTSDVTGAIDPLSRALEAVSVHGAGEGSDQVTPEMQKQLADEQSRSGDIMKKSRNNEESMLSRALNRLHPQQTEEEFNADNHQRPDLSDVLIKKQEPFNNLRKTFNQNTSLGSLTGLGTSVGKDSDVIEPDMRSQYETEQGQFKQKTYNQDAQKQYAMEQAKLMAKQLGGPADVSPRQVPAMLGQQSPMQKAPPEEVPHETLDEQSSKFRNLLNMISGGKR